MVVEAERLGWEPILALHIGKEVRFYPVKALSNSPRAIRIREDTRYLSGLLDAL